MWAALTYTLDYVITKYNIVVQALTSMHVNIATYIDWLLMYEIPTWIKILITLLE